jgi:hypothetical protein
MKSLPYRNFSNHNPRKDEVFDEGELAAMADAKMMVKSINDSIVELDK